MDAGITAVVGLVGVLVGGFVQAFASNRASTRSRGYVAARLAADGLSWWTDALELLVQREREYPRDETYDIHMAIDLSAVRVHLSTDWWEANREGLLGVASKDQWTALREAAKASQGVLTLIDGIGNVGEEVWMKRARALATPTSGSTPQDESPERSEEVRTDEYDSEIAEAKARLEEINRELEAGRDRLRVIETLVDARLWRVRDVRKDVVSARPKFVTAAEVCRSLEEATRAPVGVVGAIRRRGRA